MNASEAVSPAPAAGTIEIIVGDVRDEIARLPSEYAQTCVTSPPYFGLRDYGVDGQIGLEKSPSAYVAELVSVFREVRRVLRIDGTLWLNLGDAYANRAYPTEGLKPKDLMGIPWRAALALQADGWTLRSDVIWHKPNPMPSSIVDRPTNSHEHLFLFSKSRRYFYDHKAVQEDAVSTHGSGNGFKRPARIKGGIANGSDRVWTGVGGKRNRRDVWTVPVSTFRGAHFATCPPSLVETCVLAGSRPGDRVLVPFAGSGTVGMVAKQHNRGAILIEINPTYADIARKRCGLTDTDGV